MEICVIGNEERYEKFMPDCELSKKAKITYVPVGTKEEDVIKLASNAEILFADAIAKVPSSLILHMPKLKLIQSEGVAYNGFDLEEANKQGVYVCNCKGINKVAVSEATILLMLAMLRTLRKGEDAVRSGNQIKRKEYLMVHGIEELSEQTVGLVGFGDIAKETAKRLHAFGATVYYTCKTRKEEAIEKEYHATYLPLNELLAKCTMVSLHVPVTEETKGMVDAEFIASMRDGAYLINTARGELIDNEALREALESEKLAGAGLDTIAPEPVKADHILLTMSEEVIDKLVLSPHTAGITTATFRRGHRLMWENAMRINEGERPINVVNEPKL